MRSAPARFFISALPAALPAPRTKPCGALLEIGDTPIEVFVVLKRFAMGGPLRELERETPQFVRTGLTMRARTASCGFVSGVRGVDPSPRSTQRDKSTPAVANCVDA